MKVRAWFCAVVVMHAGIAYTTFASATSFEPRIRLAPDTAECKTYKADLSKLSFLSEEEVRDWTYSPIISRTFTWENDSFASGGDRHYTNGMKLSWLRNPCREKYFWYSLPEALLKSASGTNDDAERFYTGGVFGMNMYTPSNIVAPVRQRFDRPYVGWLYGGVQSQRRIGRPAFEWTEVRDRFQHGASADTLEIQIGTVGPRAAQGPLQEWIHRDWGLSNNMPRWETQVQNHIGAVGVYTKYKNFWMPNSWRPSWLHWLDIRGSVYGGAALGNIVGYGNAGVVLAVGQPGEGFFTSQATIMPTIASIDTPAQVTKPATIALPNIERISPDDQPAQDSSTRVATIRRPREWSLFVGTDHRYMTHSIFIQGRGDAAHDISLVRHVYDVFYGFSYRWRDYTLMYKHIRRSLEFRSPNPAVEKAHDIGQFAFEYRF
jgi:lipid A 3-O-deacylase